MKERIAILEAQLAAAQRGIEGTDG
jgi:hypothetical protein